MLSVTKDTLKPKPGANCTLSIAVSNNSVLKAAPVAAGKTSTLTVVFDALYFCY